MLPPVLSELPLLNHSATVSELVGSKNRRVPYCARSSFDEFVESDQLCSAVAFQFFRSSVWPYDSSAVKSPPRVPTRKLSST